MKDILNSYSVKELKQMISKSNIKNYSKDLKKAEIIELMMKDENKDKFKDVKMKNKSKAKVPAKSPAKSKVKVPAKSKAKVPAKVPVKSPSGKFGFRKK